MSTNQNEYLIYTEYYLISGAYHFVNVVNEILMYSASCSDNIKGYLHNKFLTKKTNLNDLIRSNKENVYKCNIGNGVNNNSNNNENNDVDEDGFVVIKMRRPKRNKNDNDCIKNNDNNCIKNNDNNCIINNDNSSDIYDYSTIIKQVMEDMIKEVIKKVDHVNVINNNLY